MNMLSFLFLVLILISQICLREYALAEQNEDQKEIEVHVKGVAVDRVLQSPVVILSNKKGDFVIPIWIGICEARSIEMGLSDQVAPRPLTYDLLAAILRTMDAEVERVIITDIRGGTYFAQVEINTLGKQKWIDARPSDSIALAVRLGVPIYVNESVIEKSAIQGRKGNEGGV